MVLVVVLKVFQAIVMTAVMDKYVVNTMMVRVAVEVVVAVAVPWQGVVLYCFH